MPQLISSYFDVRDRRLDRLENEANAERRHQEMLAAEVRREERQEERRREEQRLEDERRRQESEMAERRHQEMMTMLMAVVNSSGNQGNGQAELIRAMQQTIEDLRAENDRLRQQNGNGNPS